MLKTSKRARQHYQITFRFSENFNFYLNLATDCIISLTSNTSQWRAVPQAKLDFPTYHFVAQNQIRFFISVFRTLMTLAMTHSHNQNIYVNILAHSIEARYVKVIVHDVC